MAEYFYQLLGKKNGIMFSVFLITQFFGYLIANFVVSGKVLFHLFPFLSYPVAVMMGAIIILTYLILAGFKAVVRTDFYQLVIMVVMTLMVGMFFFGKVEIRSRVSKNAVFWLNFLPGFWTWQILWIMPILTGFGPNPRGPKSGQGKLADLDALTMSDGCRTPNRNAMINTFTTVQKEVAFYFRRLQQLRLGLKS